MARRRAYRVWNFIQEYSLLLISGALIALVWANLDAASYHHFIETPLWENPWIGVVEEGREGMRVLTLHFLVNDILMAFFFAIAAKEVWEAIILKNGALRGRKAMTPLIATAGGMLGPVSVYLGLAALMGWETFQAVHRGWAIPTATDIAFAYLVGRMVFGAAHPAIRFLLLLAIADDAAGLIILAIFYPTGEVNPEWLLLSVAAAGLVWLLFNELPIRLDRGRESRPVSSWVHRHLKWYPYAIAGALSWYGFYRAGLHPALGLIPVVLAVPHADRSFGIFAAAEEHLRDLLNQIEHMLKTPVEAILFFFGLANAGVVFSAIGVPTWLVLAGLVVGKPFGIFLFGWLAAGPMRLGLPKGMRMSDLFVLGCVAAIGFTVALFVAAVAFPPGAVQDAAKMGALFSFGASVIALIVGKLFRVQKQT